ncbi:uncharacterized protein LOC112666555 [Canis lupus dingo]|uniref:uncharacterized protein LOC112666555 n=1 Tax=Canis lupus dingo TaxID=286419 RepID=UPI000DC6BE95|nr:uncharacterized protein LOC112666555 [Canis lupus dingo]XP_048954419.1 uncharacterized protein LOC112666555 [Canis lupus dingo]XP_048954420.1 uncharacterized protein LOC112666555 [Canis lupus dingo]XP_048954421.1 uncharacterized protein LOC112666555 [Canis lupus dingo]XP_048954422.1 uncharacterized protein LOC112666555 [Canis lupus dingo]XP_048954423.1 uncharacterized protein LOC112666555 [Canis lupus dingo]XP_048954424.1 uncharacterized protein LOC112666555 [Canis lupus dingo]XP_04895442
MERLGTPQTTAPPAHEPGRPSHDCPLTTLPVVTAPSGRRGRAQGPDRTPGSQLPAQPARGAPEGTEVRAASPGTRKLPRRVGSRHRASPAPPPVLAPPAPHTHRFPASQSAGVVPMVPAAGASICATDAPAEPPETVTRSSFQFLSIQANGKGTTPQAISTALSRPPASLAHPDQFEGNPPMVPTHDGPQSTL